MRDNTDIYFVPPPVPKVVVAYLKDTMLHSLRGRDGEFCSPYMQKKLDSFPWTSHNIDKPSIAVFSRWAMSVCKKGLGRKGERKKCKKHVSVSEDIKDKIITKVESVVVKINDSFLGSKKFNELYEDFAEYGITKPMFAEILISKRKKTPSREPGKVYAYFTEPESREDDVKFGHTTKDTMDDRMNADKNTRGEHPKPIGWFYGSKADETETLAKKEFKPYKLSGFGNKEMFRFSDPQIAIDFMREEVKKRGGKMFM